MKDVLEENKGAPASLVRPTKPFTSRLRMIFYVILIAHFLRGYMPDSNATTKRQESPIKRVTQSVSQPVRKSGEGLTTKEKEAQGQLCSALLAQYVHIFPAFQRHTKKI